MPNRAFMVPMVAGQMPIVAVVVPIVAVLVLPPVVSVTWRYQQLNFVKTNESESGLIGDIVEV